MPFWRSWSHARRGAGRWIDPVVVRALTYIAMIAAGVVTITTPSKIIESSLGGTGFWQIFWSGLLIVGGLLSLYSVVRKVWWGEFSGLVGLMFALGVYSLAAWLPPTTPNRVALGFLMAGFAFGLFSRWRDILTLQRLPPLQKGEDDD